MVTAQEQLKMTCYHLEIRDNDDLEKYKHAVSRFEFGKDVFLERKP